MNAAGSGQLAMPSEIAARLAGVSGGRYSKLELLGQGGMGIVFRAADRRTNSLVAIKTLRADKADAEAVMRFHREARALESVRHPHVVRVIDASQANAVLPYIAFEYIDGATLDAMLEVSVLPDTVALSVVAMLASALVAVHARGLAHRDLKPANVFFDATGRMVLGDFGIVRGLDDSHTGTFALRPTKSIGSPLYASPEQLFRPDAVKQASDIFSLAALWFALVDSEAPFAGANVGETVSKLAKLERRPLPSTASPFMRAWLDRMLVTEPDARPSANDFYEATQEELARRGVGNPQGAVHDFLSSESQESAGEKHTGDEHTREEHTRDEHTVIRASTSIVKSRVQAAQSAKLPTTGTLVVTLPHRIARPAARARWPLVGVGLITLAAGVFVWQWLARDPSSEVTVDPTKAVVSVALVPAAAVTVPAAVVPASLPTLLAPVTLALPPPTAPPSPPSMPAAIVAPNKPVPSRPAHVSAKTEAAARVPVVRFFTKPWAKVTIDGEMQGMTPAFNTTELAPGSHVVEFANPAFKTKRMQLQLTAGEKKDVRVELEK